MSFWCKSLAFQADDWVDEIVKKIKETEKKEVIWMKNRCKSQADDERRDELADDEVKNLDKEQERKTVNFWADNWMNSWVSQTDEADEEDDWAEKTIDFQTDNETNFQETVEADEVKLNHLNQTSFMICWRVIFHLHIQCISFKSSSSLSSFECFISSWTIFLTWVFFWVWAFF